MLFNIKLPFIFLMGMHDPISVLFIAVFHFMSDKYFSLRCKTVNLFYRRRNIARNFLTSFTFSLDNKILLGMHPHHFFFISCLSYPGNMERYVIYSLPVYCKLIQQQKRHNYNKQSNKWCLYFKARKSTHHHSMALRCIQFNFIFECFIKNEVGEHRL